MSDWIDIQKIPPEKIRKEKEKAKQLRKTNWWQAELAKGICHYCKKKFKPEDLTMDHVLPISRGGKSVKGNIVPCCKECNNEKKYLTPAEMILRELEEQDNN
jgi:5-methylcytosine-specific restriction enzyme A